MTHDASTSLDHGRRPHVAGYGVRRTTIDARRAGGDRDRMTGSVGGHVPIAGFLGSRTTLRARHGSGVGTVRPDLLHINLLTSGWRR